MEVTKNDKKSLIMLISSMLIFGTIGIFRRYIPLTSAIIAFCRGIIGSVFLFAFIKIRGKSFKLNISNKHKIMLIITGAMIGINWILLFEAYNYTTVATATLCYYMQPTIVILLSPLVFKEKLTIKKIICVIVSIIGMFFVSGMASGTMPAISELKGVIFGLGAASLYAAVIFMNKKLSFVDAYEKTITELFFAAIVLVPYLMVTAKSVSYDIDAKAVIMLIIVGFVHTGIAYALYFGSMDGLKTQSIALLSYIDPVTALLLSALVLSEPFTVYGAIGAVMILVAAVVGEM